VALELGKSISLTKAEEAEAARKVHATHARIVTQSIPESAKKKVGSRSFKSVVIHETLNAPKSKPAASKPKLKGIQSLTPAKKEAADIMQALKESKKTSKRQPGTGGSSEGTGDDHISDTHDADDEDTKTESDVDEIYKYKIHVHKDVDVEMSAEEEGDAEKVVGSNFLVKESTKFPLLSSSLLVSYGFETPQIQSPLIQKDPVSVISKTTNLPPIPIILTETLVSTAGSSPHVTPTISTVQQTTIPIPTPPITTDAPTITTAVPESDALSVVYLRVAKLEKDMSELKNSNLFVKALATLKSQVPIVVDEYLESKLGDALQETLQKHSTDLIQKHYVQPAPESSKIQTSIDNVALEEYDQKNALYQTMHENKSFNRTLANYKFYHALIEALIEDENAMDNGVADTFKDHKRKHDDDDDDEDLQLDQTRVVMDDVGDDVVHDDDQPQDASRPKTNKTPEWFKQPPRPPTPDPEWNKRQVVLGQPKQPWFNEMVYVTKDPLTFNDLMATPIDFSKYVLNRLKIDNLTQDILLVPAYNLLKGTCSRSFKLEYHFQECFNALIDRLDWNNPEGDRYPFDLSKPLPLQGHPGHLTVAADYFFNNDLEYLKSSNPERTYTTSITKIKASRCEIEGIEDMVLMLWSPTKVGSHLNKFSKHNVYSTKKILGVKSVSVQKLHGYGYLEEIVVKRVDHMLLLAVQHKLFHLTDSDIVDFIVALLTLKKVWDKLHHRVHNFDMGYNKEMLRRKWTAIDRKRSKLMVELIDKQMHEQKDHSES
ncbi:hypothetical protein Tco_0663460, partial [Tanacetum coccineum]